MKKQYMTPVAKKVRFDYSTVLASSTHICSGDIYTRHDPTGSSCSNPVRRVEDGAALASLDLCVWQTNQIH